jgi:hypothetical protein
MIARVATSIALVSHARPVLAAVPDNHNVVHSGVMD